MKQFRAGSLYFLLRFYDEKCLVPTITTLIFVGMNLFSHEGDLWFFQDAGSYVRGGAINPKGATEAADKGDETPEGQLWEFPADQLHEILTKDELCAALAKLAAS